MLLGFWFTDYY